MTDTAAAAAAAPHGGGVKKKRNRKRGNGGGGGGGAGGLKPGSSSYSAKDASGKGGSGSGGAPGTSSSSRGRGSRSNRRGGTGGGRGSGCGGSGNLSWRFKPNSPSPLQLPFVKVTIRNIGDGSKHSSIEHIATSIRKFLEGAFPSTPLMDSDSGSNESSSAYMMACQLEREEFEIDKHMVLEATADEHATGGSSANFTSHMLFSTWASDDKLRMPVLPTPEDIVNNLMNNATDKRVTDGSSVGWLVDAAMSQMMQECGKQYLNYVGGRLVLDEESFVEICLAEKVEAERKRLALERKSEVDEGSAAEAADANDPFTSEPAKNVETFVEDITKGIEKMSTTPKREDPVLTQLPAVRVRIMSITPVKKSKRRGEICGKVQLVIYPPDPCILFKETCRDAGKMAAGRQFLKGDTPSEQVLSVGTPSTVQSKSENGSKSFKKIAQSPPIPYYPILSSMERSRALARSRVLMNRIIKAMELHATKVKLEWEVQESVSQKTWKERPHYFVRETMNGHPLSDLVKEHDSATNTTTEKGRGRVGMDARADRLDSTIESSDDYKAFLASLENGSNPSISGKDGGSGKKIADSKSVMSSSSDKQVVPEVDGDGRPLAAIVLHLREKQEIEKAKVEKAKAEIAAAQAKARVAAAAAKEKARQGRNKVQKETSRKTKEEAGRKKKQRSGGSSGGDRNKKVGGPMPPPGAMLLKKVGGSCPIPPSGFG